MGFYKRKVRIIGFKSSQGLSESDVTGHLHFMTLSLASTALIVGGWLKQRFFPEL